MPIFTKTFTWNETDTHIYISIPLKGTNVKKAAIISTDDYLKVSFPPFIYEAVLKAPVYNEKSVAKIGNGIVEFSLVKKVNELWHTLTESNIDKASLLEKRKLAEEKMKDVEERKVEERTERKSKQKHFSVQQQIDLESADKNRIQQLKNVEKEKVTVEMEAWKVKRSNEKTRQAENARKNELQYRYKQTKMRKSAFLASLPPPREKVDFPVDFTPRAFPTAARESQADEEERWLCKQVEARRILAKETEDTLKPEECDPEWLKEKGDSFFKIGNYHAAINAYTEAIKVNNKLPYLFSNRAACHLKIRNLHKTIEDCSKALDLLDPPVAANASSRLKTFVRRGTAFCQLKLFAEGLLDYEAALKINPENEDLIEDVVTIKTLMCDFKDDD